MKVWKNKLVILFALAGVLFLVPVVKQLIQGEPVNVAFFVLASRLLRPRFAFFVLALVSLVLAVVVDRKSGGRSDPPE